jgi:hypothetical protein
MLGVPIPGRTVVDASDLKRRASRDSLQALLFILGWVGVVAGILLVTSAIVNPRQLGSLTGIATLMIGGLLLGVAEFRHIKFRTEHMEMGEVTRTGRLHLALFLICLVCLLVGYVAIASLGIDIIGQYPLMILLGITILLAFKGIIGFSVSRSVRHRTQA